MVTLLCDKAKREKGPALQRSVTPLIRVDHALRPWIFRVRKFRGIQELVPFVALGNHFCPRGRDVILIPQAGGRGRKSGAIKRLGRADAGALQRCGERFGSNGIAGKCKKDGLL
jgi:hypothetical protein